MSRLDKTICGISAIEAFFYGLGGGVLISCILFGCFYIFGVVITSKSKRDLAQKSISSKMSKKDLLGKKNRRGPPPSDVLKPVDIRKIAQSENAPDDVKEAYRLSELKKYSSAKNPIVY